MGRSNVTPCDKDDTDWSRMFQQWGVGEEVLASRSTPATDPNNKNLRVAGFVFASAVGLTVGLTAPFIFSRSILPYMATPKEKVKRALEHLGKGQITRKDPNPPGGRFLDLGSGDGEAVYQAAKLGYQATGLELNFTLWAFASLRRRLFWPAEVRSRSRFVWGDMFEQDLREADTVMIFGVNPLMKRISQKLRTECPPGTHVLSYRFAIPLAYTDQPDLLQAKIVYDEQEMRIYQVPKSSVSIPKTVTSVTGK